MEAERFCIVYDTRLWKIDTVIMLVVERTARYNSFIWWHRPFSDIIKCDWKSRYVGSDLSLQQMNFNQKQ